MSAGYSLQSQAIATQGNVQIAGINAGVQTAAMTEAVKRAAISADMWKTGVTTSAELALSNSGSTLQALIGALGFSSAVNDSNNRATQSQTLSMLESQTANRALKTQMEMVRDDNALASLSLGKSFDLASVSESNAFTLGMEQTKNYFSNLGDVLKSNETIARIYSGQEKREAEKALENTGAGWLASIFGGGGSTGSSGADSNGSPMGGTFNSGYTSSFSNPLSGGTLSGKGWGSLATALASFASGNILGGVAAGINTYNEWSSGASSNPQSPGEAAGVQSMSTGALSGWSGGEYSNDSASDSDSGGSWI